MTPRQHHHTTNPSPLVDYSAHTRTPSRILKDHDCFTEFSITGPPTGPGVWVLVSARACNGFIIHAATRETAYIAAACVVHNCPSPFDQGFREPDHVSPPLNERPSRQPHH